MAFDAQAQHTGDRHADAYRSFVYDTMLGVYELACGESPHEGRVPRALIDPCFEFMEGWMTLADRR